MQAEHEVAADWSLRPDAVAAGGLFRLLFASSTMRDASSADIADYDAHVRTAAAAGHADIQAYAAEFAAVGSTAAVNARDNTLTRSTDTDAAIYWVNPGKTRTAVAAGYADFWDGSWGNVSGRNESGGLVSLFTNWAATGTNLDGTTPANLELGSTGSVRAWNTSGSTVEEKTVANDSDRTFLALSPIFRVAADGTTANTAPVFDEGPSTDRNVDENTAAGQPVGAPVAASDAEDDTLTYGLEGADAASFAIDAGTGQLRTSAPLDRETKASYAVTVKADDGNGGTATIAVTIDVDDVDERPVLSKASLGPAEGGSESYTVKLSARPTADVTVAITGHAGTDLTVDKTSLEFTASNWNTAQTVTVSAGQDADSEDDEETLTHTASGGSYASVTEDLPVTVDDDDAPGLTLSKASLNPSEGGSETYTVQLATEPTGTVTVMIAGHAGTDLTVDKPSLEFTTANWNAAQTVRVSAGRDDDAADDEETLTHTASGGGYGSVTKDLPVTVADDDAPGLTLSKTSLGPAEGESESYTVQLATQPTATVTVTVGGHSGTDLTVDKPSLEFTTANWNAAQTVRVSAGQDDDAEDDEETLTHTASGGGYGSVTKDLPVTVADDDAPGLTLSKTSLGPTEGESESYTVQLATQPTATVTVTVGGHSGTDLTVDKPSLEFTTANWNAAQTVRVTAGQDADSEDDEETLTHTASGGGYGSVTKDLPVTVDDDETPGLALSTSSLRPAEGGSDSYTVELSTQPTARVTVTITGHAGTDLTLDTTSLEFTASNWDTAQTVTVSAGQDDDAADDEETLVHTASGGGYGSVTKDLPVTVEDDETPGLTLSKASLGPDEGGSESYTVKLATQPTATVTVTIAGHAGTDLTLDRTSLEFTTSNWDAAQTVRVSAGQDADTADDEETLTHTASGGGYGSVTEDLAVTVDDDDAPGLTLSKTSLGPREGGSESYTVKLATQPTARVTVTITGHAGTDLTVDKPSLEFTTSNWDAAQTVRVSAGQDDDSADDQATLAHAASGGGYGSVAKDLPVTVDDDDTPALTLSKASLRPAEGESESYTVRLATQPGGP